MTSRDQAERKKRMAKLHFDDFNARTEHCLRTGEKLGRHFSAIAQRNVLSTLKKAQKIRGYSREVTHE